jgi:hypothetical protein
MSWTEYVALTMDRRNAYGILWRNLKEIDRYADLGLEENIILK